MTKKEKNNDTTDVIAKLQERAKELACLYQVEEILRDSDRPLEEVCQRLVEAIPPGWRHPEACAARIQLAGDTYDSAGFAETPWGQNADVVVQEQRVGKIIVHYRGEVPASVHGWFLPEEEHLLATIANRLGHYLLHRRLKATFDTRATQEGTNEWEVALELLRVTNPKLTDRIARRTLNALCMAGVEEARSLLHRFIEDQRTGPADGESNQPRQKTTRENMDRLHRETFHLASEHFGDDEVLGRVRKWITEDRSSVLIKPLMNEHASIEEVLHAMGTFRSVVAEAGGMPPAMDVGVRTALVRRFFTDSLDNINVAKQYVRADDFIDLVERIIFPPGSHGKLGGKSAGLFLAEHILQRRHADVPELGLIRTPRSWYIAADGIQYFLLYNDLEEVYDQKYKEIEEVRQEYPHIIQVFKNSHFPSEMVKGLALALEDLGDVPLIVRSSSLLEDRVGSAFSGKYRSLFLANQGSRKDRLDALQDAIAEVYASTFGPDPIEYRAERGLLDFNEEMGILIQEVVGCRAGRYWLPAFAGVAFSNNEFRWSPRIAREDGLLRMVPGLGTRAVDRVPDDYPILVAPSKPNLRVNVSLDETVRYSPRKVDVINLETNRFETHDIRTLLKEVGGDYPGAQRVFSALKDGILQRVHPLSTDWKNDDLVVSFEALVQSTPFVRQVEAILKTLQEALGSPVDIEFASNGAEFFLLQCRPQSRSLGDEPVDIPEHVAEERILFTANRYVSNGRMPDITHVVYVDPERYGKVEDRNDLVAVGRAVGRLNNLLPKRQFILMGPGRWGSRGDIQLGVQVTYSDINNTAMLIEIARAKGNYVPDLSFGTHFFQDLVEASIRYLPLYPDDSRSVFNHEFLLRAPSVLESMLPEYASLSPILRVIDVPAATDGRVLKVFMNAERDRALALFAESDLPAVPTGLAREYAPSRADDHWRWRQRMAERIATETDALRFGVVAMYLFGSTKNATAGPASDVDLLVHVRGTAQQRTALENWLEGWSLCLAEMNYLRTGFCSDGLLDVHYVTDEDIQKRTSFAVKIGAVTDAARPLAIGRAHRCD
ncbi:MAG: nucleotidyltransferase domain-containing protein [Deltaproteobacteria bacterium]|nr:nucleotidyltransferase domain-containing protein [Deltaproteobacteria bacterium]